MIEHRRLAFAAPCSHALRRQRCRKCCTPCGPEKESRSKATSDMKTGTPDHGVSMPTTTAIKTMMNILRIDADADAPPPPPPPPPSAAPAAAPATPNYCCCSSSSSCCCGQEQEEDHPMTMTWATTATTTTTTTTAAAAAAARRRTKRRRMRMIEKTHVPTFWPPLYWAPDARVEAPECNEHGCVDADPGMARSGQRRPSHLK